MGKAELKIEIDEILLEQARAAHLPVGAVVERALQKALGEPAAEERARKWAEENADAIKAYAERVEREGCFGEDWRAW